MTHLKPETALLSGAYMGLVNDARIGGEKDEK